jgi:O-antigen/teichoic acid export membrane protein
MSDLARRSVAAVVWNFAGGGGRALAQLFIQIALARILGPEVFGQYAIVLAVLGIGWLIADNGFGSALIQKNQIDDHDVGYALGWVLMVAIITGGGIALSANLLAAMFNDQNLVAVFRATGLLVLLQAISNIPASLMRRELDAKWLQIIQLSSYVIGFGVIGVGLALYGWGIWSLVISFLSQTLISLIAMYGCVRHTLRPRWSGDASLRSFGLRVVGTNLANWAIENLDRMVVGKIWGMPSLGAYSVTLNLSRAPVGMLVGSVQSVVFASGAKVKEDLPKLRRGYLALVGATMLLTLPLFSLLGAAAQTVIDIVYGNRWHEAAPLFCAFAVSTPLYIITAITGPLLWSMGQVGKELRIQLLVLVVMLIGFWLASDLPLSTAVWLIPALYLVRAVMIVQALSVQIKVTLFDLFQAMRGGFILAGLAIGSWVILGLIDLNGNIFNTIRLVLCAFICAGSLYLSRGWLLGVETKALLLNRKHDSGVARLILKMAGLN